MVCRSGDLTVRVQDIDECDSWADLSPILSAVPFQGRRLIFCGNVYVFKPSESLVVGRKNCMILARFFDADPVVGKRVRRVEIENEQQPGALKNNDLVGLIFEGHVSLRGGKPAVFLFSVVHGRIKLVEVFVAEKSVVDNVPLSSRVVERVVVPRAREIKPLQ